MQRLTNHMEKIIQFQLPDGSFVEKSVIECHGDCKDPLHIRVHVDPNAKPKPRKNKSDTEQMRLDLRFTPK